MLTERRHSLVLIFLLALGGVATASSIAEAACTRDPTYKPAIQINVIEPEIRYLRTKGKQQLATMKGQYHKAREGWTPVGLTHGEMKLEIGVSIESATRNDGRYCSRLKTVDVNVGFEVLDVYIAREYKSGTCQDRVVLAHERRHVLVYQSAITSYLPVLDRQLRNEAYNMAPQVSSDPNKVLEAFHTRLSGAVQRSFDATRKSMVEKNAAFDTDREYRREQKKCPSW